MLHKTTTRQKKRNGWKRRNWKLGTSRPVTRGWQAAITTHLLLYSMLTVCQLIDSTISYTCKYVSMPLQAVCSPSRTIFFTLQEAQCSLTSLLAMRNPTGNKIRICRTRMGENFFHEKGICWTCWSITKAQTFLWKLRKLSFCFQHL